MTSLIYGVFGMTALGSMMSKVWKSALGAIFLSVSFTCGNAQTPRPYLLPSTINSIIGGGKAPVVAKAAKPPLYTPCPGPNGTTANVYDTLGDGCLASSSSVVTTTDVHDLGVDSEGNIYFIDNGSTGTIRRIDAHSGIVNILAGSVSSSLVCKATLDKYGDGCPANDGLGNANNIVPAATFGQTAALAKGRGLAVANAGDVDFAEYHHQLL